MEHGLAAQAASRLTHAISSKLLECSVTQRGFRSACRWTFDPRRGVPLRLRAIRCSSSCRGLLGAGVDTACTGDFSACRERFSHLLARDVAPLILSLARRLSAAGPPASLTPRTLRCFSFLPRRQWAFPSCCRFAAVARTACSRQSVHRSPLVSVIFGAGVFLRTRARLAKHCRTHLVFTTRRVEPFRQPSRLPLR